MSTARRQRRYDHRLRDLIRETGNIGAATQLGIPRSTASGWLRAEPAPVVALSTSTASLSELEAEVFRLRGRLRRLTALLRVVVAVLRAVGVDLVRRRVPDGRDKLRLLRALDRVVDHRQTRHALALIGLSSSRFRTWRRLDVRCELDDQASCPKMTPQQLTPKEVDTIREMVTSPEYRHVPTGTLAVLAQRLGRVFASASTWCKLVRERGWRRPRQRVHPAKPKVGLRAERPDQYWHVDTTIIRLVDGTKAYVYAIIDNFSRRILSWRVSARFDPSMTVGVLLEAARTRVSGEPEPALVADGGVENVNDNIDELIRSGVLKRTIAMVDLQFSNSMIEAFWRSLKHQWLFLNSLDSVARVRELVAFYVEAHNTTLPHSAFRGETPNERYFGRAEDVADQLARRKQEARAARLEANRARECSVCKEGVAIP